MMTMPATKPLDYHSAEEGEQTETMLDRVLEVIDICAQGQDAAQYYEELKAKSDAALAQKGLTREQIGRAAFEKLTGGKK